MDLSNEKVVLVKKGLKYLLSLFRSFSIIIIIIIINSH
jgi:hypothetical protein